MRLNHFSIRTADLDASRRFYEDVLGLTVGPRPAFAFPGHWMYGGDHGDVANAVVHLIGIDREDTSGLAGYLGDRDEAKLAGSGAVDHIAFFTDGLAAMRERLQRLGVKSRERTVPGIGLHQVFVEDPCGVVIELNYPAAEAAA
jgi:catechol 2,3-dioxygenase-like lactoylglutathione lyase family enzyme